MRISFGGGPRRGRNGGRAPYSPGISFELGPVGSCIVSIFMILMGVFVVLISFGNPIMLIIGGVFIIFGAVQFRVNKRKIENNKKDMEE